MHRHLIDIADVSLGDIDHIFAMADEGPRPTALSGRTCLTAFFQESTRTRLGFSSAAARQGAGVIDVGGTERLRLEPAADQAMVLATMADIAVVRHWDARFVHDVASRGACSVVNAGAGSSSHPTQSIIDAYVLMKAFSHDIDGLRVLFLGSLLRSAVSFRALAAILGIEMLQHDLPEHMPSQDRAHCRALLASADVVYIQSMSDTAYDRPQLTDGRTGRALPPWAIDAILDADAFVMHALPRGPELPDGLMWHERSLVTRQVEQGMAVRSALLRWLVESA